jgi:hypothetical protein
MSKTIRMPKPRTQAQRAAARANGAKSNGPVTEEGKATSSLNALRHGLAVGTLVLTSESRPKFEALLQGYLDEYQPQGQTEEDLIEELAASKWFQRRCWCYQTALMDITMDRMEGEIAAEFKEITISARTALAFLKQADQSAALALLNRYAARHAREWHRALDKLRQIQKERREASIPSGDLPSHHLPNHDREGVVSKPPNEPKPAQLQPNQEHSRPIALVPVPSAADSRGPGRVCG